MVAYILFEGTLGDAYGIEFGDRIAKNVLHHRTWSNGPFRDHYSRNATNLSIVAMCLGEKEGETTYTGSLVHT